jgi:hypothetical protein
LTDERLANGKQRLKDAKITKIKMSKELVAELDQITNATNMTDITKFSRTKKLIPGLCTVCRQLPFWIQLIL